MRAIPAVALSIWLAAIAGCGPTPEGPGRANAGSDPTPAAPAPSGPIRLSNATSHAGISFSLGYGSKTPLTILETAGGGCAFIDYDGDGWPDILLVGPHNAALYHNERNGTFEDVSAGTGFDRTRYWMGCAVGDYDGDGRPDVFFTGYRCFALYHNEGGGRFRDVTAESGISGLEWSLSAAFADLSGSGRLDLVVGQYVDFTPQAQQICRVGNLMSACGPEIYNALSGKLFVNRDGRHFSAGPWHDTGKTWGVAVADLLGAGKPAVYLSNDVMPADLWVPNGKTWNNLGPASGTAYDAQGHMQGGMGVDVGDYDNDGRLDLVVMTYFAQPAALYHNDGNGLFTVTSGPTGLGPATMPYVNFGTSFVDLDNDGWLDLIVSNGHMRDNVHDFDASQSYAQPAQVFHNDGGRYTECTKTCGVAGLKMVGRGVSVADYDHDGREDALIVDLNGKAVLLHNDSALGHWLDVNLKDSGPNRLGVGALLRLKAGGASRVQEIHAWSSAQSARIPHAHFGLGSYSGPTSLSIRWPDGKSQVVQVSTPDRAVTVTRSTHTL